MTSIMDQGVGMADFLGNVYALESLLPLRAMNGRG